MPYKITKLKSGKFQVKNIDKNKIIAKGTTKQKAENQVKFLQMIDSKKKSIAKT